MLAGSCMRPAELNRWAREKRFRKPLLLAQLPNAAVQHNADAATSKALVNQQDTTSLWLQV
jgi:hypothetical protein